MSLTSLRAELRDLLEDIRLLGARVGTVDADDMLPALRAAREAAKQVALEYSAELGALTRARASDWAGDVARAPADPEKERRA